MAGNIIATIPTTQVNSKSVISLSDREGTIAPTPMPTEADEPLIGDIVPKVRNQAIAATRSRTIEVVSRSRSAANTGGESFSSDELELSRRFPLWVASSLYYYFSENRFEWSPTSASLARSSTAPGKRRVGTGIPEPHLRRKRVKIPM